MKIRQARVRGEAIVAKPVLLLALIDAIDNDVFIDNEFVINDWLETKYDGLMRQYTCFSQFGVPTGINYPFFYLESDGFWTLCHSGEQPPQTNAPSVSWLKKHVSHAKLEWSLWILLQNKEWRDKLRSFIVEKKLEVSQLSLKGKTSTRSFSYNARSLEERLIAAKREVAVEKNLQEARRREIEKQNEIEARREQWLQREIEKEKTKARSVKSEVRQTPLPEKHQDIVALRIGEVIYYNNRRSVVRNIISDGSQPQLILGYSDGSRDCVPYKTDCISSSRTYKSKQGADKHNTGRTKRTKSIQKEIRSLKELDDIQINPITLTIGENKTSSYIYDKVSGETLYETRGKLFCLKGTFYRISYSVTNVVIHKIEKDEDGIFDFAELIIYASQKSHFHRSLDKNNFKDQIQDIIKNPITKKYNIKANDKWYNNRGERLY